MHMDISYISCICHIHQEAASSTMCDKIGQPLSRLRTILAAKYMQPHQADKLSLTMTSTDTPEADVHDS